MVDSVSETTKLFRQDTLEHYAMTLEAYRTEFQNASSSFKVLLKRFAQTIQIVLDEQGPAEILAWVLKKKPATLKVP